MAINVKVLERPRLSFWEKLYIPQVLQGLMLTIRHIPRHQPITVKYPEEVKALP
ncbi:MAG: NADH-quinone oxidoreductase subunit I, partial [Candidatus Dadabacteria bacterium]|nr:NADH-quinone oxidoreductase subunit I [Candidatus Dadabacteria bacterium]